MKLLWFLALLAAACASGPKPGAVPAAGSSSPKQALSAFHELIAPLWHSPEGPERTAETCAAMPTFEARAKEVGDAPLVESVQALSGECRGDRSAFNEKFSTVHDAFHAAMEKSP